MGGAANDPEGRIRTLMPILTTILSACACDVPRGVFERDDCDAADDALNLRDVISVIEARRDLRQIKGQGPGRTGEDLLGAYGPRAYVLGCERAQC